MEGVSTEVILGGIPLRDQISALENPAPIIVGTPGRVLSLAKRGALKLGSLKKFILDECDKMLE